MIDREDCAWVHSPRIFHPAVHSSREQAHCLVMTSSAAMMKGTVYDDGLGVMFSAEVVDHVGGGRYAVVIRYEKKTNFEDVCDNKEKR